jgi:EAL domain-containing protein (putative c-di-GMP-specific phosphodiesterase class I)
MPVFESPLIAEGVETAADFCILRDLGIANAQGFFIGSGVKVPSPVVPQHVQVLSESSRL